MENASVILDTNAYRYISYRLSQDETVYVLEQIKRLERENDIVSYAAHVVAAELLSHLYDEDDPHYKNCRNGAVAFYNHNLHDSNGNLRFVADSESELCRILYEKESPHVKKLSAELNYNLHYTYTKKEGESLTEIEDGLYELNKNIQESENLFVSDMWNYVVKTANPQAQDWQDVRNDSKARNKALTYLKSNDPILNTAKGLVIKAMLILNESDTKEDVTDKAEYLINIFGVHIKFYHQILEKILIGGANVEKKSRPNWIWDLQLAFYIGEKSSILGRQTYLVTSDKEIIKSAEESGCGEYVLTTDEYLGSIGF